MRSARKRIGLRLSRWLFLRLLGVVALIAFVSLWVQIDGLIGSAGLIPAQETVDRVVSRTDAGTAGDRLTRFMTFPSLCLWAASDRALQGFCALGVVLSILVVVGVAQRAALFGVWLTYLSLVTVGSSFMSFQWDVLLLESTFLALFFAPVHWRPRWPPNEAEPRRSGVWLVRLLLFKLMFLSGVTKLLSMDPTWWGLTALDFHYYTQPLPAWTAWYAQQLPATLQKLSVVAMFVVELVVPFCVFLPRRPRIVGALALIGLQVAIAATGNYTFFNLLTVVLCVPLFDDAWFYGVARRIRIRLPGDPGPAKLDDVSWSRRVCDALRLLACGALMILSALAFTREMVRTLPPTAATGRAGRMLGSADRWLLGWGNPLLSRVAPFRTVNGYGLFRGMTTRRPEIGFEVSPDGVVWAAWEFRYKPGDPSRRPRFVAPHQPRLDWQMWFAALNPNRQAHWLERLAYRVLEGAPAVTGLLGPAPLGDRPVLFVRFVFYDYRFTTADERAASGDWWHRTRNGNSRPLRIEDFESRR